MIRAIALTFGIVLATLRGGCTPDPYVTVKAGCISNADPTYIEFQMDPSVGSVYVMEVMFYGVPMIDTASVVVTSAHMQWRYLARPPVKVLWGESRWGPWHDASPWVSAEGSYHCQLH